MGMYLLKTLIVATTVLKKYQGASFNTFSSMNTINQTFICLYFNANTVCRMTY